MQPRPQPGRKRRRYKAGGYLKGYHRFVGRHKSTRKLAARKDRHETKVALRP